MLLCYEEPVIEPDPIGDYVPTLDEIIRKALVNEKSIFCEHKSVRGFIKLTVPEVVYSYDLLLFRMVT